MRSDRSGLIGLLLVGCVTAPPPPAASAPAETTVERIREDLQLRPLEVVFSGVRGEQPPEESVALRNAGRAPLELVGMEIVGHDAELFRVGFDPQLPLILRPGDEVSAAVAFAPPVRDEPGVRRARLRVRTGPRAQLGPSVELSGLVIRGHGPDQEPTLPQILDTLGYPIEVGPSRLRLGTGAAPIGAEVRAARFRRAQPGPVSLWPVARFSSNQPVPYGIYQTDGRVFRKRPLATVAAWRGQTLNPDLEPGGQPTFDPGGEPFGVFETIGQHTRYADDRLNGGRHAVRVFPLRLRDAYVIAFDEDGDGDYQDCVFLILNVAPL
jgi:hypothetical protein